MNVLIHMDETSLKSEDDLNISVSMLT